MMWWLAGVLVYLVVGFITMVRLEIRSRASWIRLGMRYDRWDGWWKPIFLWSIRLLVWAFQKIPFSLEAYVERKLEPVRIQVELTRKGLSKYD